MASLSCGRASWRVILIQLALLFGLAALYKLYLPHRAREQAQRAAAVREEKIQVLFRSSVQEDSTREVAVPLEGQVVKRHPERLVSSFSPQEIETQLGVPDATTTDFRGGQHLVWVGTAHKLEASFDAGRLYSLALEDRATRHGVLVFHSPDLWHPY